MSLAFVFFSELFFLKEAFGVLSHRTSVRASEGFGHGKRDRRNLEHLHGASGW